MRLGWYLDTSLFKDFVERNVRIGFDTAEVHDGRTLLHVKGKSKSGIRTFAPVISNGKRFAFELTHNVNLLRNIRYSNGLQYYYSDLTKAEVFRALRKTYPERETSEIVNWWESFCFLLGNYQKVESDYQIDQELSELALNFPIKKNVQDYIHLIIAKRKGLAFITSDKLDDQIKEFQERYYPHIYFWPEIKDDIPLDDAFKQLSM
jgi:predicted nucleic acid-binding protein